jgi:hypothetical protein
MLLAFNQHVSAFWRDPYPPENTKEFWLSG